MLTLQDNEIKLIILSKVEFNNQKWPSRKYYSCSLFRSSYLMLNVKTFRMQKICNVLCMENAPMELYSLLNLHPTNMTASILANQKQIVAGSHSTLHQKLVFYLKLVAVWMKLSAHSVWVDKRNVQFQNLLAGFKDSVMAMYVTSFYFVSLLSTFSL